MTKSKYSTFQAHFTTNIITHPTTFIHCHPVHSVFPISLPKITQRIIQEVNLTIMTKKTSMNMNFTLKGKDKNV